MILLRRMMRLPSAAESLPDFGLELAKNRSADTRSAFFNGLLGPMPVTSARASLAWSSEPGLPMLDRPSGMPALGAHHLEQPIRRDALTLTAGHWAQARRQISKGTQAEIRPATPAHS
jgi:hypothetical protein